MSKFWRVLKGYLLWTYDRGSLYYDVMVAMILVFIFLSPRFINFKDQPAERLPHPSEVVVIADGNNLTYQVEASAVDATDPDMVRAHLQRAIEPISGEVTIFRIETIRDRSGRVTAYRAWVYK